MTHAHYEMYLGLTRSSTVLASVLGHPFPWALYPSPRVLRRRNDDNMCLLGQTTMRVGENEKEIIEKGETGEKKKEGKRSIRIRRSNAFSKPRPSKWSWCLQLGPITHDQELGKCISKSYFTLLEFTLSLSLRCFLLYSTVALSALVLSGLTRESFLIAAFSFTGMQPMSRAHGSKATQSIRNNFFIHPPSFKFIIFKML